VARRTRVPWTVRPGRLGGAADARAVDLAAVEEPLPRKPHGLGQPLAVGVDVRAVVVGEPPDVQRVERWRRDAAAAGGEQHPRAGKVGGDVVALPADRLGQLRLVHPR
jgi:hypothetical protein